MFGDADLVVNNGERYSKSERIFAFPVIYAVLVLSSIISNWPGRANPDTIDMLYQATHLGALNDYHAPFVTFCYGLLGPLFGYPGGALVFQAALLMLWPAQYLSRVSLSDEPPVVKSIHLGLWGITCVMLVALSGSIVKDTLIVCLISLYLFGSNLIRRDHDDRMIFDLGLAVTVASAIGIALVRPTNIGLVVATILIVFIFSRIAIWKLTLIFVFSIVVLLIANNFVKHFLLHAKHANTEVAAIVFDLAGISTNLHQDLFTRLSNDWPEPKERPWECYTPKEGDSFFWGTCKDYWPAVEPFQDRLVGFWLQQIAMHPLAYAEHRLNYSVRLLSLDGAANKIIVPDPPEYDYTTNNARFIADMPENMRIGIALWNPTIAYAPFGAIAAWWFNGPLGHPVMWAALLVAGVFLGARRFRRVGDPQTLIVSVGGLLNILMFAAFGPSDCLRYLLPSMFCAIAAVVLTIENARWASLPATGDRGKMNAD